MFISINRIKNFSSFATMRNRQYSSVTGIIVFDKLFYKKYAVTYKMLPQAKTLFLQATKRSAIHFIPRVHFRTIALLHIFITRCNNASVPSRLLSIIVNANRNEFINIAFSLRF